MRLQTNQPPIFIEGRALGHIVYYLELEEFFWCMPPPTHLNLLDRTTAIEEKVFDREQKPGLINRLRTLSHVHSSHRCSNVVATFPDDNNVCSTIYFGLLNKPFIIRTKTYHFVSLGKYWKCFMYLISSHLQSI